jgi:hypothetical protein
MARSLAELLLLVCLVGVSGGAGASACSSSESDDENTPGGGSSGKTPTPDPKKDPENNDPPPPPPATCTMKPAASVALTFEEQRLVNTLPGKSVPFATELLAGTGFDQFDSKFAAELCRPDAKAGASTFEDAKKLVAAAGTRLWRAAVDRVQGKVVSGTLPAGDDRMLYWARLLMNKTLRAWEPSFAMSVEQRAELDWEFERASRGQLDIVLPPGANYVRIVISGFDPFTLGPPGATDDVSIRIGNPSGAAALAYDGYEFQLPNGKTAHFETFILPVNYAPFERGMEEDTLGPWFKAGPSRVDISITMSQGSGWRFKLEEYNGRFHGEFEGNDNIATCIPPTPGGPVFPATTGCSIQPPERWLGYKSLPWQKDKPPQFVDSTLPVAAMIAANTGAAVPRPPDSQASGTNAFDVVWGYNYSVFPNCAQEQVQSFYEPVSTTYPPPGNPQPPSTAVCARSGGGGDYLSNESAYRATLLRDIMGLTIPVGHIHTPTMTRFQAGNESAITDAKFEAYRAAIVLQGRLLIEAVAKSL